MSKDTEELVVAPEDVTLAPEITTKDDAAVAGEIAKALADNPHANSVQELAAICEVPEEQIAHVLDSYHPDQGHVGQGQGFGWLPDEIARQYRQEAPEPEVDEEDVAPDES